MKVREFENVNGLWSVPELVAEQLLKAEKLGDNDGEAPGTSGTSSKVESKSSSRAATPTVAAAVAPEENGDQEKAEVKRETESPAVVAEKKTGEDSEKAEVEKEKPAETEIKMEVTEAKENDVVPVIDNKEEKKEEAAVATILPKTESSDKLKVDKPKQKFMFNIAGKC